MRQDKTKSYVFSVRPGFRINRQAAEDVGAVIVALAEKRRYSPKALLEAARDPRSPAHKHFQWNNRKAAEEFRLEQARLYHRAIEYEFVVIGANKKPIDIKMRVAYPDGSGGFHSGGAVITSKSLTDRLLNDALDRLESWRNQYEVLRGKAVLAGLFGEIDKVVARHKKGRRKG